MKTLAALVIGLVAVPAAKGQFSSTVTQVLATNTQQTTLPFANFGPVRNIGQSFHQVSVTFANAPSHTCQQGAVSGSFSPTIAVFGAYSQSGTLIPVPGRVAWNGLPITLVTQAAGAFPYIYVHVINVDTTNCSYSVFYSGTLYPATPQDPHVAVTSFAPTLQTTSFSNPPQSLNPGNLAVNVYALTISNDSTAANTVTLVCNAGPMFKFQNLAAGQTVSLPYTGVPYWTCPNSALPFTITATAGAPWIAIQWAAE